VVQAIEQRPPNSARPLGLIKDITDPATMEAK